MGSMGSLRQRLEGNSGRLRSSRMACSRLRPGICLAPLPCCLQSRARRYILLSHMHAPHASSTLALVTSPSFAQPAALLVDLCGARLAERVSSYNGREGS